MENKKSIFESKTFWIAVIQASLGALVVFDTNFPGIGWLAIAKSVLDIGLRYVTAAPVK
jgi:hypothetical protein